MQVLSKNLIALFRYVCETDIVRIAVIICENNQLQNFVYLSDHEPKATVEDHKIINLK